MQTWQRANALILTPNAHYAVAIVVAGSARVLGIREADVVRMSSQLAQSFERSPRTLALRPECFRAEPDRDLLLNNTEVAFSCESVFFFLSYFYTEMVHHEKVSVHTPSPLHVAFLNSTISSALS